jgi:hypothetical protein
MIMSLVYRVHPPSMGRRILVACGPGNNGECSSSYLQWPLIRNVREMEGNRMT